MATSGQSFHPQDTEPERESCPLDSARLSWLPGWRDPLTGVFARAGFEARLHAAIAGSAARDMLALLVIDVDRFQQLNTKLSPAVADELLCKLARLLTDAVDSQDTVARLGGNEFAVLSIVSGDDATAGLADRLLALAGALGTSAAPISLSIGYATLQASEARALPFMRSAQAALHAAKLSGRGRAVSATRLMAPPRRSRDSLRLDLDHAIRSRGLSLVWQPYQSAVAGETVGYEALLRWNRPGYGPTPPDLFVAEAEVSGLIGDLDAYVLRAACLEGARWRGGWRVNVNVSSHWFVKGRIADLVADVLTETGLPGRRLLIEITERTCLDCGDTALQQLEALRALGVRIALDDFGTGYSSLSTISELPVDEIKIDRSLVRQIPDNRRADIVLRSVVALARALDIEICAEGVETEAQRQALASIGCDLIQGYLIGRPGEAPES